MNTLRPYVLLALIAFFFHLPWEYLHLPLYHSYETMGSGWRLILMVSGGDALYTLLIAGVIAVARKDSGWLSGQGEYGAVALLGFLVALAIEYKALYLHRWAYAAAMPIIPLLGVGLSPIAQMTLLTPIALWCTRVVLRVR